MRHCLFAALIVATASGPVFALEPFGPTGNLPARAVKATGAAPPVALNIFQPANAGQWNVEYPVPGAEGAFALGSANGEDTLTLQAAKFSPTSTLRTNVPPDRNGALWSKNRANYVSFMARSDKRVTLTFHLLQKGKTPGTFKAPFTVEPGAPQRIVLGMGQFDLKSFSPIVGVALRVASPSDAVVSLWGLNVGGTQYNEDSWKTHRLAVPLTGEWRFAMESGGNATAQKWAAAGLDDGAWKIMKTGLSWKEQGESQAGWGWYRQQINVPQAMEGTPLWITLPDLWTDDETYFNGTRIGGWSGEYKYQSHIRREYAVPRTLIKYGQPNTIAVRIWGGDLGFTGNKASGLSGKNYAATLDPYRPMMRLPGGEETPAELFDLSEAQRGLPFDLVFRFPAELTKEGPATLSYQVQDVLGNPILSGKANLMAGQDGIARAVVPVSKEASQVIYLRGRLKCSLLVTGNTEAPLYSGTQELERLSFERRDNVPLAALPESWEDTPYGKLRLVDEIDAARATTEEPHGYVQSGPEHIQDREMPGTPVAVRVTEILGRKARESDFGWYAYKIGRGELKPHSTYLVRIEYPEDKPRYAPVEFQIGQNYLDIGWKNGVSSGDPYDPWPLSGKWQWFDTIVPLDDETMGTGGTGTASARNGFWIYFFNKIKPGSYHSNYAGGPAVGRIKLYEIDPEKNAPVINLPQNLPQRVLMADWERQADHDPADLARYARLMGLNALSPTVLKWGTQNWGPPLNGYDSTNTDARNYWVRDRYDPKAGRDVGPAVPGRATLHERYLAATKQYGLKYIPRIEYGGSADLPEAARALGPDGQLAKPNRFATWSANLLNTATWDDLQKLIDSLYKPYAASNPQLAGALWRIRQDRMPISYGPADLELFARETGTALPAGGYEQKATWAAGEGRALYDAWWHGKRAAFHRKLVNHLKSFRADMRLYYYNWDGDKFSLIEPDHNTAAFNATLNQNPGNGAAVYAKDAALRASFTAEDYISVVRSGNFGKASKNNNRADYALRPELYRDISGVELFAPANAFTYADKPAYLNYFRTAEGLAVSNVVSYDEIASRSLNPKFEGHFLNPAGPEFSMALELLSYFHGDARTVSWTSYQYGRGFADAHRRFAQAFLALPALEGQVLAGTDADVRIRLYPTASGTYVGVACKSFKGQKITVKVPGRGGQKVTNLVTGEAIHATLSGTGEATTLTFEVNSGPMELNSYLVR